MERGQVLVVAAAIAVVGVFVAKVLTDRTSINDDLVVDHSNAASDGAPGASGGVAGGGLAARGGHHKFDTAAALRAAAGGGSARGTARDGGQPGAGAQGAGLPHDRSANAGVGSAARANGAPDAGSGGAHLGSVDAPAGRAQRRADVMNMLAQPSAPGAAGGQPRSPNSEVALEVHGTEDSDQASRSEDIDTPADGSDGIKFTDASQLTFAQAGGANGEQGTITFDVEPDWSGGDATDNSLVQIRNENEWANRLQLVKNGRFLRFILADDTGREADISVPIDEWQAGQSHSVSASWGDGQTSLFIDGRLAGSNTYQGNFNIAPTTPLHLGSDFPSSDYGGANATIRGFTLFKKAQNP